MKQITLILLMTFSLMSFKQPDFPINPTQYKMRLEFIQSRCRMLEEMFNKDYLEGRMRDDYRDFYVTMIVSLDSCASDLKYFKVE